MDEREHHEILIDEALGDLLDLPEVWIVRPLLYSGSNVSEPDVDGRKLLRSVESYAFLLGRSKSVYATHGDCTLVCWGTENQRRSLGRFAEEAEVVPPTYQDRLRVFAHSLKRRTQEIIEGLDDALSGLQVVPELRVARLIRQAVREMIWTRGLLDAHEFCRLLVTTQHNVQSRAAAVVAREAGIPTVYIPHAPVARNREYADIPFDYAALRGEREVHHYAGLGADRDRLKIVGNMALDDRVDQLIPHEGPILVAPSPWSQERVRDFIEMVDQGVNQDFLVCPHPRSNPEKIRELLPARGKVAVGEPTWQRLARGARVLIQSSSGVALEALLMGLPVIEVRWDGSTPSYPIIREPYVYFADDAQDIGRIVELLESRESEGKRRQRRAWAREWCAAVGREAETRLASLLEEELWSTEGLIDGWRMRG